MQIIAEPKAERAIMLRAIKASAIDGKVKLLEAGCGQKWGLIPDGIELHITGVDLDADALRIRQQTRNDLQVAVVGDLHDVVLPKSTYDVVYCSYVLEHVHDAEIILDRMVAALRPGGRFILRVPDGKSVFGWFAKNTPHRTHVWFKKYVERFPDAGKPGHAPYPTVYDPVVSAKGLTDWAGRVGIEIEQSFASNHFMKKFGRLRPAVQTGLNGVAALSRGQLTARWNNVGFVFVKGAQV